MQAASREQPVERGFQPLGIAVFVVLVGAIPSLILWLAGAPVWTLPLPLGAGLLALVILASKAASRPRAAGFQRAATGLLAREGEGPSPRWVEVPDEKVYGWALDKGTQHDTIAVFYEESEERPVAQRFASVEVEDEDVEKWLGERFRKLDARGLGEPENLRRIAERTKTRGWQKDVMLLPEDLRSRIRRTCETLLQLPIHTEVRYHSELIDQYLPQLGNLLGLLRKWVSLKNPGPRPAAGVEEDTLVLETFLTAARVLARIRDPEEEPAARYRKWDLHFRPICLALAQASGSQVAAGTEPPIILGPTARAPQTQDVPTDSLPSPPTPPAGGGGDKAAPRAWGGEAADETVIESGRPIQGEESWPRPVRDFVRELQTIPWLSGKQIPTEARGLVTEHLRRLQPFRRETASYAEALTAAKQASLDLKEWAAWDPSEDDTWWIQFHGVRKRLDKAFGEKRAGEVYARLKELCEVHLLWESAHPPPAEPNPWAPVVQIYRLGLSLSFESVEPFGTVLEVPFPDPGKARNLEVVLPK